MSSPDSLRYRDILSPVFVDATAEIDGALRGEYEDPIVGMANLQTLIVEAAHSLDWDSFDLAPMKFGSPEDGIGLQVIYPSQYAERLISFAVTDCYEIIKLAQEHAEKNDLISDLCQLLINSKPTLLKLSALSDSEKRLVLNAIKFPDELKRQLGTDMPSEPLILELDRNYYPRFAWNPVIDQWIDTFESEGCPARKVIITDENGKKQLLTHYFWDKLVTAMYGEAAEGCSLDS